MSADDTQAQRNRMRVLLRESEFRSAAWRTIMGEKSLGLAKERLPADASPLMLGLFSGDVINIEYEVDGWDARLSMPDATRENMSPYLRDVYLRLEPVVGDEFPDLLRAMRSEFEPTFGEWRALIIDQLNASTVSLDDVRGLFEPSDINVLTVAEIRDALTADAIIAAKEAR